MEFLKKLICCLPPERKQDIQNYENLKTSLLDQSLTQSTITVPQKKQQEISLEPTQNTSQDKSNECYEENIFNNEEENVCNIVSQYELCQFVYQEKEVTYQLGFINKANQKESAYVIRHIKYKLQKTNDLYYKIALENIKRKLNKYKRQVFFYCMSVTGMNACARSNEFIKELKNIPLYLVYLTVENSATSKTNITEILPIMGGPSSIKLLDQQSKNWIILDYGQHGVKDNVIKQNLISINKILSGLAQAFHRSNNVAVIFPWGVTKAEIQDLHRAIFPELVDSIFNFDVQLHSYGKEDEEACLIIGYYGENLKFKSHEKKDVYTNCILTLFDQLPNEHGRLYAMFDYLLEILEYGQVIGMVCEMRHIDKNPEHIMAGFYSHLKEMARNKGISLQLQGEDISINFFDFEADISLCKKKIIEKRLQQNEFQNDGNEKEDYLYRQRFYNRARFFSHEFHSELSSNGDKISDDFQNREDSLEDY